MDKSNNIIFTDQSAKVGPKKIFFSLGFCNSKFFPQDIFALNMALELYSHLNFWPYPILSVWTVSQTDLCWDVLVEWFYPCLLELLGLSVGVTFRSRELYKNNQKIFSKSFSSQVDCVNGDWVDPGPKGWPNATACQTNGTNCSTTPDPSWPSYLIPSSNATSVLSGNFFPFRCNDPKR